MNLSLTFEGKTVRMVGTPERPEWVAKDVCEVLGLDTSKVARTVPAEEKGRHLVPTPGGDQEMVTVTEGGLWRLVFRSDRPDAERLRAWVFNDVLPTLRKHGQYPAPAVPALPPLDGLDLRSVRHLAPLALQLVRVVQEQQEELEEARPKAQFFDEFADAKGLETLQGAGRILTGRPNKWIRSIERGGYLFRQGGTLVPYAEYLEAGLFRVLVRLVNGREFRQAFVTPKGMQYFARKIGKAA